MVLVFSSSPAVVRFVMALRIDVSGVFLESSPKSLTGNIVQTSSGVNNSLGRDIKKASIRSSWVLAFRLAPAFILLDPLVLFQKPWRLVQHHEYFWHSTNTGQVGLMFLFAWKANILSCLFFSILILFSRHLVPCWIL